MIRRIYKNLQNEFDFYYEENLGFQSKDDDGGELEFG